VSSFLRNRNKLRGKNNRNRPFSSTERFGSADLNETGEGAMTGKTVTRVDLGEAVCQKIRLSRAEAAKLVEGVLEGISETLARGEREAFRLRHIPCAQQGRAHRPQSQDWGRGAGSFSPCGVVQALEGPQGSCQRRNHRRRRLTLFARACPYGQGRRLARFIKRADVRSTSYK
jgi:hypothetical protein